MSARLLPISGLGAKEAAAFLVEADGKRLLLDCGEVPKPGRLPDLSTVGRVDAVILSHGHTDHAGALRLASQIGNPPVYATDPVLARLQKQVLAHLIPIHGRAEIAGIEVLTGANGHAPGGVWLRLAVGEGLLYLGDVSLESQLYAFDPPPPAATLIIDASYGDADNDFAEQRRLTAEIAACGPVLFPVPADGRGPEIAIFLQQAGFEVAIDAAVRTVASMLTQTARPSVRPSALPALQELIGRAGRLDEYAEPFGVMVAHGGTGDAGLSGVLIRRWLDRDAPEILFTGHLAEGTTGRRLMDAGRARFQRWNVHPTLSDNLRLVESVGPARVVPAFGDAKFYPVWAERLAPRVVLTAGPVEL